MLAIALAPQVHATSAAPAKYPRSGPLRWLLRLTWLGTLALACAREAPPGEPGRAVVVTPPPTASIAAEPPTDDEQSSQELDRANYGTTPVVLLDGALVPAEAPDIGGFAPEGWSVETSVLVDFDRQEPMDVAAVLIELPDPPPHGQQTESRDRALLFALGLPSGAFRRIGVATKLALCTGCGGAMWVNQMPVVLSASDDGREAILGWTGGASDRWGMALFFAATRDRRRVRLVRLTESQFADGGGYERSVDFVSGVRTERPLPPDGSPPAVRHGSPSLIFVEDVTGEEGRD